VYSDSGTTTQQKQRAMVACVFRLWDYNTTETKRAQWYPQCFTFTLMHEERAIGCQRVETDETRYVTLVKTRYVTPTALRRARPSATGSPEQRWPTARSTGGRQHATEEGGGAFCSGGRRRRMEQWGQDTKQGGPDQARAEVAGGGQQGMSGGGQQGRSSSGQQGGWRRCMEQAGDAFCR
jgi:hypothetical protein